jgi:ABC-2 type transport system permease protein
VKREYVTRVRTKAFLWGTIALPLFTIGILVFQIVVSMRQLDHTLKLAILDDDGGLSASITQHLTEKLPGGLPAFQVLKTLDRPASEERARKELLEEIRTGQLDAFLVVPKDAALGSAVEFHTKNPGNLSMTGSIHRAVSDAVIAWRLSKWGIQVSDATRMTRAVDVKLFKITRHGESEEQGQTVLVAIVAGLLLYATLVVYGVATMRSVMEEKSTRIIEILVASVKPFYLLCGKVLGVAAVALTQYLIWAAAGGLVKGYGLAMASAVRPGVELPKTQVSAALLVYMAVFFLAGYLLYASLYAAVGAMVSTEQEAQQAQAPLTMLIVLSFLLFNVILRDPNSRTSVVLSLVPFLSPVLMILRIAMQTPPFWQIALSLALSLVTTAAVVYFSAKIYRVGVLMYGKRPSLVELFRWLRYT